MYTNIQIKCHFNQQNQFQARVQLDTANKNGFFTNENIDHQRRTVLFSQDLWEIPVWVFLNITKKKEALSLQVSIVFYSQLGVMYLCHELLII
mgnify:CR=1 FL=1